MRKKLLFGLLTLSCLALVACQGGTSTSSNSSSSNPSSNTSLPSEEGYLLTVETLEGGTVSIVDASENSRYEGGRTISFTVDDIPSNKALLNVRLNDVNLTKNSDGIFSFVMPKMFNLSFNTPINKDIILHENITIITDYFFNCFENNIYHELKDNTNYKIDKTNIKDIFTSSVNHYLLESAKEQDKDIKYINDTVKDKPYDPVIDNICHLVKQHVKDKE